MKAYNFPVDESCPRRAVPFSGSAYYHLLLANKYTHNQDISLRECRQGINGIETANLEDAERPELRSNAERGNEVK